MKIKRAQLRQSARLALAEKGYSDIELIHGPGLVSGARLHAKKEGKPCRIAVRTSSDREVALLRTSVGEWRTIHDVDLVVVAVPADDTPAAEVLAFDPKILIKVFDARVQAIEKNKRDKSRFKVPVFVRLDDVKASMTKAAVVGLKKECRWQVFIPLGKLSTQPPVSDGEAHRAGFYEQIKKQIADFNGVDIGKVDLQIRINP
jgi:hypothetical protein